MVDMEIFGHLEQQEIYFCSICKNIIKLNLEAKEKEYNPRNKKMIQINLPSSEELQNLENNLSNSDKQCFLCLNIFDISNNKYELLLNNIKSLIGQYDHTLAKLVIQFSCIFNLIFWFINSKTENYFGRDLSYIFECDTLRQIFISKFTNFFGKELNIKFSKDDITKDLELIINFDINDKIFQKYNDIIISSIDNNNKKINLDEVKEHYLLTKNAGRAIIKKITQEICDKKILFSNISKLFSIKEISSNIISNCSISPTPLYISGNYIKLSREIGQTHFAREFNLSSVDEEITKILSKTFKNSEKDFTLSAGGREDRDVRMLGSGRSFIYEIQNSKKKYNLDFTKINEEFNSISKMVKIKNLKESNKTEYGKIKKDEIAKTKKYIAVIYTSKEVDKNKINSIKNLEINQITPIRVLHQRALKERKKQILELREIERLNEYFLIIEIIASAGTYIKEFVHGDCGRTFPSLGVLLECECDILQLDVEDIVY